MQRTKHRHEIGDLVWIRIGDREPFQTTILEKLTRNGRNLYRIEWSTAGFNKLLNSVAITEDALYERRT